MIKRKKRKKTRAYSTHKEITDLPVPLQEISKSVFPTQDMRSHALPYIKKSNTLNLYECLVCFYYLLVVPQTHNDRYIFLWHGHKHPYSSIRLVDHVQYYP